MNRSDSGVKIWQFTMVVYGKKQANDDWNKRRLFRSKKIERSPEMRITRSNMNLQQLLAISPVLFPLN